MARTVVGYFDDRPAADTAYNELVREGYSRDDISIVGRGAEGKPGLADHGGHGDHGDHVTAGEGAALGGITGLLLGVAAMLIPGIGPIVAVGPISAALAGAVTGGVTGAAVGGITGALTGAGVDEADADYYNERFQQGGVLMTVHTDDARYDHARSVLQRNGADIRGASRNEGAAPATTTGGTARREAAVGDTGGTVRREGDTGGTVRREGATGDTDRRTVELREEELRARKETVQAGEVGVRKEVVSEQQTIDVPVKREEVVIERHPVHDRAATNADFREGQEIRVPVTEERVDVEKRAVVTEEVNIGKRQVQETQHVTDTVRHEEARIEQEGNVRVGGTGGAANRAAHEHKYVDNSCSVCGERRS